MRWRQFQHCGLLGSAAADPARATTTAATDACLLNTRHGPVRHARDKAGDGRRCMVGLIGHLPASRSAIHHSRVRRRYTLQVCRTRNRQGEHNYGCQDQSPANSILPAPAFASRRSICQRLMTCNGGCPGRFRYPINKLFFVPSIDRLYSSHGDRDRTVPFSTEIGSLE